MTATASSNRAAKALGDAQTWFEGWRVEWNSDAYSHFLSPDLWLDCRDFADWYILVEYMGPHPDHLAVELQTAVAPMTDAPEDDGRTWLAMMDAPVSFQWGPVVIEAPGTGVPRDGPRNTWIPPMGLLRLKLTIDHSDVNGTIRAVVLGKKAA